MSGYLEIDGFRREAREGRSNFQAFRLRAASMIDFAV